MQTRIITSDERLALSTREESHFFERKSAQINGRGVQKICVAFANADGGELLIGLADNDEEPDPEKRWHGVSKIEDLNSHLQSIFDVKPSLDLRYEFLKCEDRPNYVLRVMVEKGQAVHRTADNSVYQRYGAQSLPIKDPQQITELSFAKGASSFEDSLVNDLPAEQVVDAEELLSFLASYSPKTDPLDYVVNQNLLDAKTWVPRVAAALLFHQ
jgi:ATP-dependent DNA helicase RecG